MSVQTLTSDAVPADRVANDPSIEAAAVRAVAAATTSAPTPEDVLQLLPEPAEIARLTQEAFTAAEKAARLFGRMGEIVASMADVTKRRCDAAAVDVLKKARGTCDSVQQFSDIAHQLVDSITGITENLEAAEGGRSAETDAYGIGANNGRGR